MYPRMLQVVFSFINLEAVTPKHCTMKRLKLLTLCVAVLAIIFPTGGHAQIDKSLNETLESLLDGAETYQDYKVIRTSDLRRFKHAMQDSLSHYRQSLADLTEQTQSMQATVLQLRAESEQLANTLATAESRADMIGFLGMDMKKATYSIFVWSLVVLLCLCLVIMYGRIRHVCGVVKRVKSAYSKIVEDYRNQRFQATEKQIKLKRELQTALNQLELVKSAEA